jgi:hypothetical protein
MLTRAIGAQWAAVWSGVRDPLCAPWAQWRRAVSCSSALVETPAMRSVTRDRHADDTRIWAGPTKWCGSLPRGSRTSPPRRRSRKACGQHGKSDPEPRGCREPPRMDGRPRYSMPVVAHWPAPEPAATSIGLLDGRTVATGIDFGRVSRPLTGKFPVMAFFCP